MSALRNDKAMFADYNLIGLDLEGRAENGNLQMQRGYFIRRYRSKPGIRQRGSHSAFLSGLIERLCSYDMPDATAKLAVAAQSHECSTGFEQRRRRIGQFPDLRNSVNGTLHCLPRQPEQECFFVISERRHPFRPLYPYRPGLPPVGRATGA